MILRYGAHCYLQVGPGAFIFTIMEHALARRPWRTPVGGSEMGRGFAVKQASVRAKPRTMYLETVDWAISNPSIKSSPWMRDAPHCWFSLLIR